MLYGISCDLQWLLQCKIDKTLMIYNLYKTI